MISSGMVAPHPYPGAGKNKPYSEAYPWVWGWPRMMENEMGCRVSSDRARCALSKDAPHSCSLHIWWSPDSLKQEGTHWTKPYSNAFPQVGCLGMMVSAEEECVVVAAQGLAKYETFLFLYLDKSVWNGRRCRGKYSQKRNAKTKEGMWWSPVVHGTDLWYHQEVSKNSQT